MAGNVSVGICNGFTGFAATGSHKTVLNGTAAQTVDLFTSSSNQSRFFAW